MRSKVRSNKLFAAITLLFLLYGQVLYGQFQNGSNVSFGKNRVQHAERIWSFYRTDLADVYYYPQSQELAGFAVGQIPTILDEMENKLGLSINKKMIVVIYARHSDFNQSNIGLESEDFYNTGGVSSIFGNKIFLYFKGNSTLFYQDLRNAIARLLIENSLVGSSVGSNIASSYTSDFPTWFSDGLSLYLATGILPEMEAKIRDGILSKRYQKMHLLSIEQQKIAGLSFWTYLTNAYGQQVVPTVLYYASRRKNYDKAFLTTCGKTTEMLIADWLEYYTNLYQSDSGFENISPNLIKQKKYTNYLLPRISPDGKTLVYVANKEGKIRVWLLNMETNKKKCIYYRHYSIEDNPDYSYPIPLWHPNSNMLLLMEERKDKVFLLPYQVAEGKYDPRQIIFINKITTLAYSDDGKRIALSAVNKGQSDIYIYNMATRSLEQITDDKADDFAPAFVRNNSLLAFSSNRNKDTLGICNDYTMGNYKLFLYDLQTKNSQLTRITFGEDYSQNQVMEAGQDYITFLQDHRYGSSRYLGKFENVISRIDTAIHYAYQVNQYPIGHYQTVISQQDVDKESASIYQQVFHKGQWQIDKVEYGSFSAVLPKETRKQFSAPNTEPSTQPAHADSVTVKPLKRLRQVRLSDLLPSTTDSSGNIGVDSALLSVLGRFSISDDFEQNKEQSLTPRIYEVQYHFNKLVAQADFSFLNTSYQQFVYSQSPIYLNSGINALMMVGVTDVMEDHRMIGGVRLSFVNLGDMELLFSYENLKRRLDHQLLAHYQTQRSYSSNSATRLQNISLFYILKYPFDKVQSLRLRLQGRYNRLDYRSVDDVSLRAEPQHSFWLGATAEYVVDYTRQIGINMHKGFRSKLFIEPAFTPAKEIKFMTVVGADLRHYTKIAPTLIWANRLAGSTSFGNSRLIYYMGGVDNWIFAKFNSDIPVDQNINYVYQTLATNMRGFSQNIRNGTNFAVFNSEIRWQFIQSFFRKPLRSEFLQSLQLVGFFDIGTAWNGLNPYDRNNALYQQVITSGNSVTITLQKQTEPIVYGLGAGLRFMLFGYFVRLDYAWGAENHQFNKGVFYLSLNLDF